MKKLRFILALSAVLIIAGTSLAQFEPQDSISTPRNDPKDPPPPPPTCPPIC